MGNRASVGVAGHGPGGGSSAGAANGTPGVGPAEPVPTMPAGHGDAHATTSTAASSRSTGRRRGGDASPTAASGGGAGSRGSPDGGDIVVSELDAVADVMAWQHKYCNDGYFDTSDPEDVLSFLDPRAINEIGKTLDTMAPPGERRPVRWKRGELLGSGAFGRVYLGLNEEDGTLMAAKQIPLQSYGTGAETAELLELMEREISLMSRLRHDNIVQYVGCQRDEFVPGGAGLGGGKGEEFLTIFMEYVPGGSIASLLKRFGKLNETLVRIYTKQILTGLAYLHAHGVVHRDIKGGNILVDRSGVCKLSDFGASKSLADLDQASISKHGPRSLRGTPAFMAPEVVKQTGYGRQSDIWSVGCTVIEMVTGKPPWSHYDNPVAAMFAIAVANDMPPLPPDLSPDAVDFLRQCFNRNAKERPTAAQLLRHPFIAALSAPAGHTMDRDQGSVGKPPSVTPTTNGGGGGGGGDVGAVAPSAVGRRSSDMATGVAGACLGTNGGGVSPAASQATTVTASPGLGSGAAGEEGGACLSYGHERGGSGAPLANNPYRRSAGEGGATGPVRHTPVPDPLAQAASPSPLPGTGHRPTRSGGASSGGSGPVDPRHPSTDSPALPSVNEGATCQSPFTAPGASGPGADGLSPPRKVSAPPALPSATVALGGRTKPSLRDGKKASTGAIVTTSAAASNNAAAATVPAASKSVATSSTMALEALAITLRSLHSLPLDGLYDSRGEGRGLPGHWHSSSDLLPGSQPSGAHVVMPLDDDDDAYVHTNAMGGAGGTSGGGGAGAVGSDDIRAAFGHVTSPSAMGQSLGIHRKRVEGGGGGGAMPPATDTAGVGVPAGGTVASTGIGGGLSVPLGLWQGRRGGRTMQGSGGPHANRGMLNPVSGDGGRGFRPVSTAGGSTGGGGGTPVDVHGMMNDEDDGEDGALGNRYDTHQALAADTAIVSPHVATDGASLVAGERKKAGWWMGALFGWMSGSAGGGGRKDRPSAVAPTNSTASIAPMLRSHVLPGVGSAGGEGEPLASASPAMGISTSLGPATGLDDVEVWNVGTKPAAIVTGLSLGGPATRASSAHATASVGATTPKLVGSRSSSMPTTTPALMAVAVAGDGTSLRPPLGAGVGGSAPRRVSPAASPQPRSLAGASVDTATISRSGPMASMPGGGVPASRRPAHAVAAVPSGPSEQGVTRPTLAGGGGWEVEADVPVSRPAAAFVAPPIRASAARPLHTEPSFRLGAALHATTNGVVGGEHEEVMAEVRRAVEDDMLATFYRLGDTNMARTFNNMFIQGGEGEGRSHHARAPTTHSAFSVPLSSSPSSPGASGMSGVGGSGAMPAPSHSPVPTRHSSAESSATRSRIPPSWMPPPTTHAGVGPSTTSVGTGTTSGRLAPAATLAEASASAPVTRKPSGEAGHGLKGGGVTAGRNGAGPTPTTPTATAADGHPAAPTTTPTNIAQQLSLMKGRASAVHRARATATSPAATATATGMHVASRLESSSPGVPDAAANASSHAPESVAM